MAKKKASPAKQASAAGNRRAALRAEQAAAEKKARYRRILIAIACVVALALIAYLIVWSLNRKPAETTPTPTPTTATTAQPSTPSQTTPQVIPPDGNTKDIAQAAWITVPSSNTKPDALAVDIHTDYQCPYCELVETSYATLFEKLNDQGDIVLRQHTRSFLDGANTAGNANSSSRAAIAAACVDVADNTKYAAYHNLLFEKQPKPEGTGYTDAQLRDEFPATVGLTGDALAAFQGCYDSRATAQWVANTEQNNMQSVENAAGPPKYLYGSDKPLCYVKDANGRWNSAECTAEGATKLGVMGTPYFFVNSVSFGLTDLFNSDYTPRFTSSAALLTFLQQKANS